MLHKFEYKGFQDCTMECIIPTYTTNKYFTDLFTGLVLLQNWELIYDKRVSIEFKTSFF